MNELALFVKPWRTLPLPDLARHVRRLGFDLIELPVRPGYTVQPDDIERSLPEAKRILAEEGVRILNVTVSLALDDERLYSACAAADIRLNRVMFSYDGRSYQEAEDTAQRKLDSALPFCQQYRVRLGVQNHYANLPGNALGLKRLLNDYDPQYVGAVWDAAHESLEGIDPELALDVVQSHLYIVNLKNAFWLRTNGPEAEDAEWAVYWTSARQGRASWKRVLRKLKAMQYTGPICLTAEYSQEEAVDRLIAEDLAYTRALLEGDHRLSVQHT